nr:hypothetical protein [Neisseria iguanae]
MLSRFACFLNFVFDSPPGFGQTLHALFGLFETVIGTALRCQQLPSYRLQDTADGHSAGTVLLRRQGNADFILCIGVPNGLAVVRG